MRSIRIGGRSISYDICKKAFFSLSQTYYSENEDPSQRWNHFESDSGTGSVCSDYVEDVDVEKEVVKKMIKPDILTMSKLLNFDEVKSDDLPFYH